MTIFKVDYSSINFFLAITMITCLAFQMLSILYMVRHEILEHTVFDPWHDCLIMEWLLQTTMSNFKYFYPGKIWQIALKTCHFVIMIKIIISIITLFHNLRKQILQTYVIYFWNSILERETLYKQHHSTVFSRYKLAGNAKPSAMC